MTAELERDHPKTFPLLFNDKRDDPERPSPFKKSEPIDVLIPLLPTVVDRILEEPWCSPLVLPELPQDIRRIWIYETEPVNAVSTMIRYTNNHLPRVMGAIIVNNTRRCLAYFCALLHDHQ